MQPAPTGSDAAPTIFEKRRGGDRRADQQARFELALDASGVGMWDWDLSSEVIAWDERTCAIFGVPSDGRVPYALFLSLIDPEDREPTRAAVDRALDPQGDGHYEVEYRVTTPDGERRIISARGRALFVERDDERVATRFVGTVLDITERRRLDAEREMALAALRDSEQRYALAARAADSVIWDWDVVHGPLMWSDGITRVFGYAPEDVDPTVQWWAERVHPDDQPRVLSTLEELQRSIHLADGIEPHNAWHASYRFRRADGQWSYVVDRGYAARNDEGRVTRMIGAMEDETERERLEERLRQAQKMEAVGQLAGGIAHDFNNLLTVISGNLEFAQDDLPTGHPVRRDLEEIGRATERARELVRQLLAFSRKQTVTLQPLDVSDVVRGAESLLRRVIGEEIVLDVHLESRLPAIRGNRGQLEQVLLNLAVNARDAMLTAGFGSPGRGGTLTIDTAQVLLSAEDVHRLPGLHIGPAVRLRIKDSGHGMDDATRARAFEPFFTTKAVGAGTGLGLATVFGIVQQFGGAIALESVPGAGTLFSLYFPVAGETGTQQGHMPRVVPRRADGATILLVEDENAVRAAARRMLERQGHVVLEARHGADALLVWRERRVGIDLVVTDLRMPEMGGREMVEQMRREVPLLPVVYVSGYSEQSLPDASGAETVFLEKPFTMEMLLNAVERVRGGERDS
ncbi:MAG: PAS domain-containing protein [Gemmatimonadaceae bacterium]|nr:PAS domain-containing protein [Gemmatimonadaceae bacterium]